MIIAGLLIQNRRGGVVMEEKPLLLFRGGTEIYGVPIDDVSGIISNAGINGLSMFGNVEASIPLQDKSIPNPDMDVGLKKSAIITHVNGVQILIIVDEVIQERKLVNTGSELDARIVPLQIWKFNPGMGAICESDESERGSNFKRESI